jgi:hypothetical protein
MAFISYWSSQSDLPIDSLRVDRLLRGMQHPLAHAAAFAILALLAYRALRPSWGAAAWAVLLAAGFGAVDEWQQSFTPGRVPDPQDWLVDVTAAVACVVLLQIARQGAGWLGSLPPPRIAPVSAALTLAVVASVTLATVATVSPVASSGSTMAKRSLRVAARLVPDGVESRALRLADRAVNAARAARAEIRAQLAG